MWVAPRRNDTLMVWRRGELRTILRSRETQIQDGVPRPSRSDSRSHPPAEGEAFLEVLDVRRREEAIGAARPRSLGGAGGTGRPGGALGSRGALPPRGAGGPEPSRRGGGRRRDVRTGGTGRESISRFVFLLQRLHLVLSELVTCVPQLELALPAKARREKDV